MTPTPARCSAIHHPPTLLPAGHAAPSPVGFEAALALFPMLAGRLSVEM
jgi:hypothetical protein